jgi:Rha family phage regulatory protein
MNELVYQSNKGTPVTNSLLVAQKFGKEHKDVLRTIRNLTAENCAVLSMFYETTYYNEQNKQQPMFVMNRDGFTLLVMGFTGKEALKFKIDFIEAFNKMEELIKSGVHQIPQTFSEALMLAARQAETIERQKQHNQILEGENEHLTAEVRYLAPKAEYTDKVLQSTSTYTMTQVGKEFGMSAVALEKRLHKEGIMFKQSGQWFLYAKYQGKGYTQSRTHHYEHKDGTAGTNTITVWTERGRAFVHWFLSHDDERHKGADNQVLHKSAENPLRRIINI